MYGTRSEGSDADWSGMARTKQGRQWPTDTAQVCPRAIADGQPQAPQETNAHARVVYGQSEAKFGEGRNVVATTFSLVLARWSPRARK
eukprot:5550115-Pleurochrysis_carterae.AAC.3